MATATRIYLATIGDKQRLVRASRPGSVMLHVANDVIKVKVPTQDELIEASKLTKVEEAGEDPQQEIPT